MKKILLTGGAGYLGMHIQDELRKHCEYSIVSVDVQPDQNYTNVAGSIDDLDFLKSLCQKESPIYAIIHTAALHKPHIDYRKNQEFIDVNISGTLNLLECARIFGIQRFVFTSTTAVYGDVILRSKVFVANKTTWIDESVIPVPRNIYGITKIAAEQLVSLYHKLHKLNCITLRIARIFPEIDDYDDGQVVRKMDDDNKKAMEFLYRRGDVSDIVQAHLLAVEKAPEIGHDTFVISSNTPFVPEDIEQLSTDFSGVVKKYYPDYETVFNKMNWITHNSIDRVYCSRRAMEKLGYSPKVDFGSHLKDAENGLPFSVTARDFPKHTRPCEFMKKISQNSQ